MDTDQTLFAIPRASFGSIFYGKSSVKILGKSHRFLAYPTGISGNPAGARKCRLTFLTSWRHIDFSRCYILQEFMLPLTNGLCCIQTTHTVQTFHWKCCNTKFVCNERKASISKTFILGFKLTNQSWSSSRNVNKTARKSLKFQKPDMGAFKDNIPL